MLLRFLACIFIVLLPLSAVSAGQVTRKKNPEKALFGKHRKAGRAPSGRSKTSEPKAVRNAKKKQADNQLKLKKEYFNYVDESKKRAYKIQSPEVRARMDQNQKDIKEREKIRKQHKATMTKRGAKKYRK